MSRNSWNELRIHSVGKYHFHVMYWLFYSLLSQLFYILFPFDCCFLYGAQIRWAFIFQTRKTSLIPIIETGIIKQKRSIRWNKGHSMNLYEPSLGYQDTVTKVYKSTLGSLKPKVPLLFLLQWYIRTQFVEQVRTDSIWVHVRDNNGSERHLKKQFFISKVYSGIKLIRN